MSDYRNVMVSIALAGLVISGLAMEISSGMDDKGRLPGGPGEYFLDSIFNQGPGDTDPGGEVNSSTGQEKIGREGNDESSRGKSPVSQVSSPQGSSSDGGGGGGSVEHELEVSVVCREGDANLNVESNRPVTVSYSTTGGDRNREELPPGNSSIPVGYGEVAVESGGEKVFQASVNRDCDSNQGSPEDVNRSYLYGCSYPVLDTFPESSSFISSYREFSTPEGTVEPGFELSYPASASYNQSLSPGCIQAPVNDTGNKVRDRLETFESYLERAVE